MTPLEEYLYFDSLQKDSSADAATVLTLRGPFHLEAFKNAVHQVLTRSAYASAVVRTDDHGAIYWETTKLPEDSALFRCVPGDFDESACALEPLDITREPGIRFWIYSPEPELTKVVFQFHHVMTDALGSFLFLEEILRLYAGIPLAERETPTLDAIQRSQKIRPTWQLWWSSLKQLLIWLQPWRQRPFRLRNPKVQVLPAVETQTPPEKLAPATPETQTPATQEVQTQINPEAQTPATLETRTATTPEIQPQPTRNLQTEAVPVPEEHPPMGQGEWKETAPGTQLVSDEPIQTPANVQTPTNPETQPLPTQNLQMEGTVSVPNEYPPKRPDEQVETSPEEQPPLEQGKRREASPNVQATPEAQAPMVPAAPITDSASPQSPQIKTRRLTFSAEATLAIRREAKTAGVTLNDWLLTRVFQALESWKQQAWPQKRNPLYRIAIPVSMRTDAHRDVTLGNIVSSVFLDQCSRACRQPFDVLLAQVAKGTRKLKQPHRRQFLLFELQGLHDFRAGKNDPRFGMRWFTSRSPHLETLVLSNLGVVLGTSQLPRMEDGRLRVGDLVLEDVFLVSPHTTGVALTIPAGTYAGKLRLHFCYDASQLTESDVQQLMKSIASTTPADAFTLD